MLCNSDEYFYFLVHAKCLLRQLKNALPWLLQSDWCRRFSGGGTNPRIGLSPVLQFSGRGRGSAHLHNIMCHRILEYDVKSRVIQKISAKLSIHDLYLCGTNIAIMSKKEVCLCTFCLYEYDGTVSVVGCHRRLEGSGLLLTC